MNLEKLHTEFAPAERASSQVVLRQAKIVSNLGIVCNLLDGVPELLLVLNKQRQIVYSNQCLLDFLGVEHRGHLMGVRPGEALDCVRSYQSEGGCGTTEFCKTCGAVKAILASQRGKRDIQECRIIRRGEGDALDLRITATPVTIDGEPFTFFSASDISDQKRREALERIFFHDILNTAGGLLGFAELMRDAPPEDVEEYREEVYELAQRVVEEIKTQRELLAAENNELATEPVRLESTAFLEEMADAYRNREAAEGRVLQIDPGSQDVRFTSDKTLLGRVIGNMAKNALEASQQGETVTLGAEESADGILFWVHNQGVMPRDAQLQVFQRSFSTKGKGRGLGTYSIKLLTERYLMGQASFSSSAEEGTTFRVHLPLVLTEGVRLGQPHHEVVAP